MKIIAVDDEPKALSSFLRVLREVEPYADVASFTSSEEAFAFLAQNRVDIAFLDIKMDGLTGLALAEKYKSLCPTVNIIFVTGYSQYSMDALRLHVSGYLIKPVRADDLRTELASLRHPLPPGGRRVRIQTFGNFEVFVDGQPLKFPLTKCKECLAYLVDRKGALVTIPELASVLWEDKPVDHALRNNIHQMVFSLTKALKAVSAADILIKQSRQLAIDPEKVDCDYYRALSGDAEQLSRFAGEYMNNYSWAEFTIGKLLHLK